MTSEMLIPLDRTGTGALDDCYFRFNLEPMRTPSGRVYGMMALAVDITPQVQARKALERVVRLPLAGTKPEAKAEAPATAPPPRRSAERGCRILLVDDNEDAAEMLAESLRGLGHVVHAALDGPSALEHAKHDVPDVALLDLGLAVIEGYELAVKLRQQDGWEDVPLAALTG